MIFSAFFKNFFESINVFNAIMTGISLLFLILYIIFAKIRINGIVVMSVSLILFVLSILLKNLFLQFLSFAVLFIFDFIFVYYVVTIFIYLKKNPELNSINHGVLHPFENSPIDIEAGNLPVQFPGIHFLLGINIFEKNEKLESRDILVDYKNRNLISISLVFHRHGNFTIKEIMYVFRDIFGFTEFRMKVASEYNIVVYPFFMESINIPFFLDKGGEEILQSKTKVNSTDFFENRKYYPGDDTRRINWKIFAHTKELHIREVEKIPPKIGQVSVLFAPYSKNLYEFEYISSIFLATINFLLKNDFQIKIFSPGSVNSVVIDKSNEKEFDVIVANSYKPFGDLVSAIKDKPVVFASFEEYNKLIFHSFINKCFCAVTFFDYNIDTDYLKRIIKVDKYDNIIREIIFGVNDYKAKMDKEKNLKDIEEISVKKNIELNLYRINHETDNLFK